MNGAPPAQRSVLFLQGMASQFFTRLGAGLAAHGHRVHRINFNFGDRMFWRLPGSTDFRGRAEEWPSFLVDFIDRHAITDIVLFGDCRPLHRAAIPLARQLRVTVHVCEEGYIRPNWVTFELDGVNGHSSLPRSGAWFRETAAALPPLEPPPGVPSSFSRRAIEDLTYNMAAMLFGMLYPHYQTHRPRHRLVEYAGWSRKMARRPIARRRAQREAARVPPAAPCFLLPLQLNADTQIRLHSRFSGMQPVISQVITSFAANAPADAWLVIKEHPLDDGLVDWRKMVAHLAAEAGIADRVAYLELGDIGALIGRSRGVVTVNSTTGTLALAAGVPVITLGLAIYDMDGLTFQGQLDRFWAEAQPPDPALFAAFRTVLAHRCLLAGDFFSDTGIGLLVKGAIARLEALPAPHASLTAVPASPLTAADQPGYSAAASR